jgi:hypothetical protein
LETTLRVNKLYLLLLLLLGSLLGDSKCLFFVLAGFFLGGLLKTGKNQIGDF